MDTDPCVQAGEHLEGCIYVSPPEQIPRIEKTLEKANDIVANIRALRAEQCLNCGLAYYNWRGTHDWKGWWIFRRPKCEYKPVGWDNAK